MMSALKGEATMGEVETPAKRTRRTRHRPRVCQESAKECFLECLCWHQRLLPWSSCVGPQTLELSPQ
jgi:hypothetical protein